MAFNRIQKLAVQYGTWTAREVRGFEKTARAINRAPQPPALSSREELALYQYLTITERPIEGRLVALEEKLIRLTLLAEDFDGESFAQFEPTDGAPIYYGYSYPHRQERQINWDLSFKPGDIVWEIGCGEGNDLLRLAQANPETSFVGCEANAENLRAALLLAGTLPTIQPNVRLLLGDFTEKGVPAGSINAVILKGTIAGMRFDMKERLLAGLFQALSPQGGRLYVDYLYVDGRDRRLVDEQTTSLGLSWNAVPLGTDHYLFEEDRPIMLEVKR
jgi:hypothetical protein